MLSGEEAVGALTDGGVELFVGVPDSLMEGFCAALEDLAPPAQHIVAHNEGAALAMGAGHFLATGRPALVYLQNSGLGNAVNPLVSLTPPSVYGIPAVLLIGWRGQPGLDDEPQHTLQGRVTLQMLELVGTPATTLSPDGEQPAEVLRHAVTETLSLGSPVAVVVEKGTFEPLGSREAPNRGLTRVDALEAVLDVVPGSAVYVATTGYTSRELAWLRGQRGESWDSDFLVVGSMGHASSIALGMAAAAQRRPVFCLDGDGAVGMHMGSMAAIARASPKNLVHIVFNNRVHESVGGQPSVVDGARLEAVASALGYRRAHTVGTRESLTSMLEELVPSEGPSFLQVEVVSGTIDGLPRPAQFGPRKEGLMLRLADG